MHKNVTVSTTTFGQLLQLRSPEPDTRGFSCLCNSPLARCLDTNLLSMQLFLRCGGEVGVVPVQAQLTDTFQHVMARLGVSASAATHQLSYEFRSRSWPAGCCLSAAGLQSGDFVQVCHKLRGGGGDGGSTGAESRSSFLEMYATKKAAKINPVEAKLAKWTRCNLSGEPLQPPCVADELGNLYNKDVIVQALVTKSLPGSLSYISSLKHLTDLKLTKNDAVAKDSGITTQGNFQPSNEAQFVCPVTGQQLNGRFRFSVLRKTGHVISDRALKEVPQAVKEHVGWTEEDDWTKADLMPINGSVEEVEQLREQMLTKRAAIKAKKQSKKATKIAATGLTQEDKQLVNDNAAKEESQVTSASQAADLAAAVAAQVQVQLGKKGGKRDLEDNPMPEQEQALIKKFKASDRVPAHASKNVYSSIFMSSRPNAEKESYTCRSTSARGMNMT